MRSRASIVLLPLVASLFVSPASRAAASRPRGYGCAGSRCSSASTTAGRPARAAALRDQRRALHGARAREPGRRRARRPRLRRRRRAAAPSGRLRDRRPDAARRGETAACGASWSFYYSGHSDEEGLLLGSERVSYDELRTFIQDAPADLRVAILDSCASGAFTRDKGGVRRAPFLLDASIDMRGHAFLTSSAANEVAQESDRIAASFFTYYLVSGPARRRRRQPRPPGDAAGGVSVRLRRRRWRAPSARRAGPQHAAYEFDLTGHGRHGRHRRAHDAGEPRADARARRAHQRARGGRRAGRRAAQAGGQHHRARRRGRLVRRGGRGRRRACSRPS